MWDDHTALMAFGTTMWGLNRAAYGFGYWGYENPYYTESYPIGGDEYVDYSQPMMVEAPAETAVETPAAVAGEAPAPGVADFDAARQAFYQGDYASAMSSTNKALASLPNDPIIHEFRALILFAEGKYQEGAAGLYSVLSAGPGWDWTTLSSLYASTDVYTKQLRALEKVVREKPKATDARFVLAYHYLTMGKKDAAVNQLKQLHSALPNDHLITQLLQMTGGPEALGSPSASEAPSADTPAIEADEVVGSWAANGANDEKFAMDLKKDGTFSWTYTVGKKSETVKGVYAVDKNVLAMEPDSGGSMLAELSKPESGRFSFKLLGAPPHDPGLKFQKSNAARVRGS
jgi:tetratricopeptide (TPR) repeat protein